MRLKRPFPKPKPSVSTIRTSHLQASFAKDCTCPGSLSGLILSDLALVHQVERKAQFLPTYIKLNPFRRISSLRELRLFHPNRQPPPEPTLTYLDSRHQHLHRHGQRLGQRQGHRAGSDR